jgi:hypothetical protein
VARSSPRWSARDLEREEWVSARRLEQPQEDRPPERGSQPVVQKPVQRTERERADADRREALAWQREAESERRARRGLVTRGDQQANA